jgi:hypothetical protein
MIRKSIIALCAFLALGCLVAGWISRSRDLFLFESDNAPTRYYRTQYQRRWRGVLLEYSRQSGPRPRIMSIGFCDGRFRVNHLSPVPSANLTFSTGREPPIPEKINLPGLCLRAEPTMADLTVSPWLLFALFGFGPTLVLIRGPLSRSQRRKKHQCLFCGYSLTGNTSGVCPECGTGASARVGNQIT